MENAQAMDMKKLNVMNTVVQVSCIINENVLNLTQISNTTERPYWGKWEDWSVCSKKCGGGVSYRKRKCIPSKCPSPYYKTCQGRSYEEKKCNEKCCPGKLIFGSLEPSLQCVVT